MILYLVQSHPQPLQYYEKEMVIVKIFMILKRINA